MSYGDVMALMPTTWDEHEQWDVYYEAYQKENLHIDPMMLDSDLMGFRFIHHLIQNNWRKIWLPGCGLSVVPYLFAVFGFEVWASDVSTVAVQGQEQMRQIGYPLPELVDQVKARFKIEDLPINTYAREHLHLVQHDLQTEFVETGFDCILNIRAYQGFPQDTMSRVSQTHWRALASGRQAIFDTMNVQGERRNQIENCLIQAGFYIPGVSAEQWYRKSLNETGIPHIFILGQPFPLRGSERYEGENGQEKFDADRKALQSFQEEYYERLKQGMTEDERLLTDGNTKIASVIYSTG